MKEFNVELAKQGIPVCTRNGNEVEILKFDAKGDYPIIALAKTSSGGDLLIRNSINGKNQIFKNSKWDLFLNPEKIKSDCPDCCPIKKQEMSSDIIKNILKDHLRIKINVHISDGCDDVISAKLLYDNELIDQDQIIF